MGINNGCRTAEYPEAGTRSPRPTLFLAQQFSDGSRRNLLFSHCFRGTFRSASL